MNSIDEKELIIEHFADRLIAACRAKGGPVCVGLDPVFDRLPAAVRGACVEKDGPSAEVRAGAIKDFCMGVLGVVAKHVACVKIQSACFERYFWHGVKACHDVIHEARQLGLVTILDAKRGDIGISSEHYAAGCLGEVMFTDMGMHSSPDALTVNPYLGADGLEPFMKTAATEGKGLFVLVRTSNPGGDAIQGLKLEGGKTVAEAVGGVMAAAGANYLGTSGYSLLGAVVGATKAGEIARLREVMPQQIFLVPGFGAQGGGAADVKASFKKDGTGAIITASRSILYAYEEPATADWQGAIEQATVKMKQQIAEIIG